MIWQLSVFLFGRAAHLVNRMFSLCYFYLLFWLFPILGVILISAVPGHSLPFIFLVTRFIKSKACNCLRNDHSTNLT